MVSIVCMLQIFLFLVVFTRDFHWTNGISWILVGFLLLAIEDIIDERLKVARVRLAKETASFKTPVKQIGVYTGNYCSSVYVILQRSLVFFSCLFYWDNSCTLLKSCCVYISTLYCICLGNRQHEVNSGENIADGQSNQPIVINGIHDPGGLFD